MSDRRARARLHATTVEAFDKTIRARCPLNDPTKLFEKSDDRRDNTCWSYLPNPDQWGCGGRYWIHTYNDLTQTITRVSDYGLGVMRGVAKYDHALDPFLNAVAAIQAETPYEESFDA